MSHFGLFFFFFLLFKNRWRDSSKEKQEATLEPPNTTQSSTHHPTEQCNGGQRDNQEEADYRQDGKAAAQPPCKEQQLDGSMMQSVDNSPGRSSSKPEPVFSVFLSSYFAVNYAERTACPKQARSKQPKANTGRTMARGRGKGSISCPFTFAISESL